ncbi:MAG: hypothetical protein HY645_04115 [Acidobacteria bacterium]|nr:hypothetical protein [Acidobacteriota bacterium]
MVFTGGLDRMTRSQARETVIQQGGRVSETVSRKTDFLVVGARPGATKTAKARNFAIRSLTEDEFLRLIK